MTKEQIILISENIRRFSLTMPDNTIEDREEFWSMCEKAINTIAKNNEVLDLVSDCKKPNIHECLNDLEKAIEVKTGVLDFIDKGSLRYQLKKAIDKMICCR